MVCVWSILFLVSFSILHVVILFFISPFVMVLNDFISPSTGPFAQTSYSNPFHSIALEEDVPASMGPSRCVYFLPWSVEFTAECWWSPISLLTEPNELPPWWNLLIETHVQLFSPQFQHPELSGLEVVSESISERLFLKVCTDISPYSSILFPAISGELFILLWLCHCSLRCKFFLSTFAKRISSKFCLIWPLIMSTLKGM